MTDAVQVAIIAGAFNIIAVLLSRMETKRENAATSQAIASVKELGEKTHEIVNGQSEALKAIARSEGKEEGVQQEKRDQGVRDDYDRRANRGRG